MRGKVAVRQTSTLGSFESLVIPRSVIDSGCMQSRVQHLSGCEGHGMASTQGGPHDSPLLHLELNGPSWRTAHLGASRQTCRLPSSQTVPGTLGAQESNPSRELSHSHV